jgi:hypothetical protein
MTGEQASVGSAEPACLVRRLLFVGVGGCQEAAMQAVVVGVVCGHAKGAVSATEVTGQASGQHNPL